MDILGLFTPNISDNQYVLNIVDQFTMFPFILIKMQKKLLDV